MRVDIWSDIVCPWCYVGKRRFEVALSRFEHKDKIELVWRSFELDPNARHSNDMQGTYAERLARKYRTTVEGAQEMVDHMTAVGAGEGIEFRFDLTRGGNTFDAHRLLHLALERGVQDELKERFDRATFSEGLAVSDHDSLVKLAVEVGLDEAEVRDVLDSDRYAAAVRRDEQLAAEIGIEGVPFFVIAGRLGVSGAQTPDVLLGALERAWADTGGDEASAAPACGPDGC